MEKLLNALKSRTTWTIIVLFIINGIDGIREQIPANLLPVIDGVLSMLAVYFRANPKADL